MKIKIRVSGNWKTRENISMTIYIGLNNGYVKIKKYVTNKKPKVMYLTWVDLLEIRRVSE